MPETQGSTPPYGQELVLDLHACDTARFTRADIAEYFISLCEMIDMERCDLHFWDDMGVPVEDQQIDPRTTGTSAVQFILTSTIVIHTLTMMEVAYVNIFSCKPFDADAAGEFTAKWFRSKDWTSRVLVRR